MTKQEEFKQLRRKYFWEQKLEEISKFGFFTLAIPSVIITILYFSSYLGRFLNTLMTPNPENYVFLVMETFWQHMAYGIIGIICLGIFVLFFGLLYVGISEWIKDNWKKADERAKKELKIK